jgi:hypothetical protein
MFMLRWQRYRPTVSIDIRLPCSGPQRAPRFDAQSIPGTTRNKSVSAVFSRQAVMSA